MLDRKDEVSRLLNDSGEEWAVREKIKRQKQISKQWAEKKRGVKR